MQFGDDDLSDTEIFSSDSSALPFPKPLDRSAFLAPKFSAAEFLSSLTSRFQTLEDLQTELQDLLKSLNKELVDLVNDNYTDFLNLGEKLKGGEERIEEVRVGLLGFQRDVTSVRNLVSERTTEIKALLDEKRDLRKTIRTARTLLEVNERVEDLEIRVGIAKPAADTVPSENIRRDEDEQIGDFKEWSEEWTKDENMSNSSAEEEDQNDLSEIPSQLKKSLRRLRILVFLSKKCGENHPFISTQRDRISQIKDVLRKDLENAIRNQPEIKVKQRLIQTKAELDD